MVQLFRFMWGDVSKQELKSFGILSVSLLCIICTSEMIRPIKDALFITTIGKMFLPYAKICSLAALVVLLMGYAKLVDWFEKNTLVYLIHAAISFFVFSIATILLFIPDIGTRYPFWAKVLGWTTFIGCECSIVLLFSLYWSYLASSMDTATAKKGYPLIVAGSRIGAIAGPLLILNVTHIGVQFLLAIAGICVLTSALSIKIFSLKCGNLLHNAKIAQAKPTGAIEGLALLFKHPYLMGIFFVTVLPDVIGEILHFNLLFLAESHFKTPDKIIAFLGIYGIVVSCISLILALLGTSFFLRKWGLASWLILYPLVIFIIILYIRLFYSLWAVVFGMALLKSLGYALDQPCRDIMFIPTSRDIMFKSKSWIGAFGARFARGLSAGMVVFFASLENLIVYGSIVSFCLVGIWLPIAQYVGKTNTKLVLEDKVLE